MSKRSSNRKRGRGSSNETNRSLEGSGVGSPKDSPDVKPQEGSTGPLDSIGRVADPTTNPQSDMEDIDRTEHDGPVGADMIYDRPGVSPSGTEKCGGDDPFSTASLLLPQDFLDGGLVESIRTFIPVGKPERTWWFRICQDESYELANTLVLDYEGETFLIAPSIREDLLSEACVGQRRIVTGVTKEGKLFLWPLKPPRPNGRTNAWSQAAFQAAHAARTGWIRMVSDMRKGEYEVLHSKGISSEPQWPKETFSELLKIGFKDRYIDSLDHEILRQLRGEA